MRFSIYCPDRPDYSYVPEDVYKRQVEHNVGKIAQYAVRVWGVPESEDKKAVA